MNERIASAVSARVKPHYLAVAALLALAACAAPVPSRSQDQSGGPTATPGLTPDLVPTATPLPTPAPVTYRTQPGSPFTIIDNAEADLLFSDVDTCTNPAGRFTVRFPAAWYTNPTIGALPACSWFAPTPFSVSDTTVVPPEVQIIVQAFDGAFGYFDSPEVTMSEQILIGGHEGDRLQQIGINHESGGHESLPPSYIYNANFGGPNQEGPSMRAIAASKGASDYILNKAVLDRIMASLVIDSD
jgi:hypothetical protein